MHVRDRRRSACRDTEALGHFFVEETLAGAVGLNPLAVDDELWDGPFAGVLDYFVDRAGRRLNIDFGIGNIVLCQKALSFTAIGAPLGRVDGEVHTLC
jgi:hypothetical protein